MRWYEYKMEVEDLHASEDLKNRLLAMQAAHPGAQDETPALKAAKPPRKKAIRFPRRLVGLAACCALCGVCLFGAVQFRGVDLVGAGSAAETSYASFAMDEVNSSLSGHRSALALSGAAEGSDRAVDSGSGGAALSRESVAGSMLIYTANLSLETKDFDAARTALSDAVAAAGGYMESNDESSYSHAGRSLSLTVRVPQANYASFLEAAAQAGNLVNKSQQVQDVTAQYMDTEARLASLTAQRTRLQELQASAQDLSDLLEIEASLSDVQYQIESWQSQLDWYSQQVACSTVYLSLEEVKEYTPVEESFSARLLKALQNGWSGFVEGVQGLAVLLAQLWPLLVILALVLPAIRWLRRRARR